MNLPRLNDEQIDTIMTKLMPVIADPDSPDSGRHLARLGSTARSNRDGAETRGGAMTELDAHLLQASIDECNKIRHGIQEAILKCFPIGSKTRSKISGDMLEIVATSPNLGCLTIRDHDKELRDVYWANLEPINDAPATP